MTGRAAPAVPRGAGVAAVGAVLALARWPNALIAAAGVVVGAWWAAAGSWRSEALPWAAAAAALIAAFVNATNDLADVAIDRLAHPRRPLADGRLTTRAARAVAVAAALGALAASARAGGLPLAGVTLLVLAAALAYSPGLKRHGTAGNVAVALVASLPFAYGAYVVDRLAAGLPLVLVAVPLHFARELAKDLDDAEADASGGRSTLPHRLGTSRTRYVVGAAVVVHAGLVMFLLVGTDPRGLAMLPALALAAYGALTAGRGMRPRAPLLLKLSMLLAMGGLLALR